MMNRNVRRASLTTAAALFGLAQLLGCNGADETEATSETLAALTACHLNDGTVEHDAMIRACDPQDAKKTTICHVPPGNPANAHTLCIGNAAVPAHLAHHSGDHVGPCQIETRCPPPPGGGGNDHGASGGRTCSHADGGLTGAAGHTGSEGPGGHTGSVSTGGTSGGNAPDAGIVIL